MSFLDNKVIWLTGASTGIGEAVARELIAQTTCKLALSSRRAEPLEKLANDLAQGGRAVKAFPVDVANANDMRATAELITAAFGPIDVLIANAGTHIPGDSDNFRLQDCETIMKTNYFGVLHALDAVLPSMRTRRSGYIVGVSSVAGYRGLPGAGAYCASKAALTSFLESLRFDVALDSVAVTIVSPGFVKTPLTDKNDFPMPFMITAEQAARHIVSGMETQRLEIHFPWQMSWSMKLLRVIPFPLYHWIISKNVIRKR